MKDWIIVALFGAAIGVSFALIGRVPWPTCKPGDPGIYIGGTMLLAGCPR